MRSPWPARHHVKRAQSWPLLCSGSGRRIKVESLHFQGRELRVERRVRRAGPSALWAAITQPCCQAQVIEDTLDRE